MRRPISRRPDQRCRAHRSRNPCSKSATASLRKARRWARCRPCTLQHRPRCAGTITSDPTASPKCGVIRPRRSAAAPPAIPPSPSACGKSPSNSPMSSTRPWWADEENRISFSLAQEESAGARPVRVLASASGGLGFLPPKRTRITRRRHQERVPGAFVILAAKTRTSRCRGLSASVALLALRIKRVEQLQREFPVVLREPAPHLERRLGDFARPGERRCAHQPADRLACALDRIEGEFLVEADAVEETVGGLFNIVAVVHLRTS